MKALHLCLVVLFCTVCLFAVSAHALPLERKQALPMVAADPAATAPAALPSENKKGGKPKIEYPTNVNINTADRTLLIALPGIGPKTADAIIAYRQNNGNFKNIGELTKVKGIGDKTLTKLKPYLQEL